MQYYYLIGFFAEFLAAISATVFLYKYKKTALVWLLPLLWYIPLNEILCQYVFPKTATGYILYNIYRILVPITIMLLILSQLKKSTSRTFVKFLILILIISVVVDLTTINPFEILITISFTISSFLIIIALLSYFIEELNGDRITNVGGDLFLWVAFGFLIFHLAFPVIFFAQKYLAASDFSVLQKLYKIQFVILIISYLIIAFGFYRGEKRVKKNNV